MQIKQHRHIIIQQKDVGSNSILVDCGSKEIVDPKMSVAKKMFGSENILGYKILGKKMFSKKRFWF